MPVFHLLRRTAALFGGIGLLLLTLPSPGQNRSDLSEYQKRLEDIGRQISRIRKSIESGEKQETSLQARLETLGLKRELARREIALYNTRLEKANRDLDQTQKQIREIQKNLEGSKAAISRLLAAMYKFGRISYLDLILQVEDVGSLISDNKNLMVLARSQEKILNDFLSDVLALEQAQKMLENQREDIRVLLKGARSRGEDLVRQERESRVLIDRIKQDRKLHLQRIDELAQRQEALQDLIKDLLSREVSPGTVPSPLYERQGRLDWPIEGGRVILGFGSQVHPRFYTRTNSNGIEIAADEDTVVKAVHPGTVAFADYFQGFGQLIILDHGVKFYTLYGRCSNLLVKAGDSVEAGQAIAMVGDIGTLEGHSLYFAVRSRDKFLNPLQWLKRR